MNFDEYQKLAMRTAPSKDKLTLEMHSLHGMASEVGELHGIYQKTYQGHSMEKHHAMSEDWITVYRELCDLGAELYDMPFNKDVFGEYLKRKGWIWYPCKSENGKRPKVCNFDKANSAILRVANHLVYVSNHEYYDTWDCGNKSVYGYWAKLN